MVASTAQRIAESDIITIIRKTDPETAIGTVGVFRRDGVSTVEVTMNTESILNMIRDISESFTADEVTTGTGAVLDAEMAWATTLADAEFIVTPPFDEGAVEAANRYGVPPLVGIATPTEAVNAFEADTDMVRVFLAGTLGPRFVSALGDPLGHTPTVPTGGVGLDNVDEFFDAGITAVGVGSSIVGTGAIACGEFGVIETNAHVFKETVEAVRSEQEFDWLRRPRQPESRPL